MGLILKYVWSIRSNLRIKSPSRCFVPMKSMWTRTHTLALTHRYPTHTHTWPILEHLCCLTLSHVWFSVGLRPRNFFFFVFLGTTLFSWHSTAAVCCRWFFVIVCGKFNKTFTKKPAKSTYCWLNSNPNFAISSVSLPPQHTIRHIEVQGECRTKRSGRNGAFESARPSASPNRGGSVQIQYLYMSIWFLIMHLLGSRGTKDKT